MENYKVGFSRVFNSEIVKLKHSVIWLTVLGIPIVSVLIGTGNYIINQEALHGNPWTDLWSQVALFYGYFLYPISLSIIAAYLWRLEHSGSNWNLVKTLPIPASTLWLTNLLTLYLIGLLIELVMLMSYWFMGTFILKLPGPIPLNFLWYLIAGPFCGMAIGSIQLYVSLKVKSFAGPIAFCFFCCFIGLYCYTKGFWLMPNTLAIIGINAQHATLPTIAEIIKVFLGTLFWIALSSVMGIRSISKMET